LKRQIKTGISGRHLHVSESDREKLFGKDQKLTKTKELSQKGQFATGQTVTLVGPKGSIDNVRILGPEREKTQVEVCVSDLFKLGLAAPVRDSGDTKGTPGIVIIGSKGAVQIKEGLICAKRHIHMTPEDALSFGVKDKEEVSVKTSGERSVIFQNTLIRVDSSYVLEFHIDTDEANSAGISNREEVEIIL
jgi:putative phosphotransacetylase